MLRTDPDPITDLELAAAGESVNIAAMGLADTMEQLEDVQAENVVRERLCTDFIEEIASLREEGFRAAICILRLEQLNTRLTQKLAAERRLTWELRASLDHRRTDGASVSIVVVCTCSTPLITGTSNTIEIDGVVLDNAPRERNAGGCSLQEAHDHTRAARPIEHCSLNNPAPQ